MRNFDIESQFNAIKKSAEDAVRTVFPVEGKIRKIELERVWIEDTLSPSDYSLQAKVKAKSGTYGVPVYATLVLKESGTGKVVDRAEKVRLFNIPKATDRFSYIVNGNEYQVANQLRLKPGAYTLRQQNGELKTQVNLAKGKNFNLMFNEVDGLFLISKVGGGQSNVPLYPLLAHLGVSHQAMERAWGSDIARVNKTDKGLDRAAAAFGLKSTNDLKDYFGKTLISPETTKMTLGQAFEKVDGPMLLASSKKLLEVHLGKKEPEDRDALEFKELHSIEDFLHERLDKNKDSLAFKIKRSIDNPRRTTISSIVNPASFNSIIESFFTQDDKSSTPEQTNPLEMLSGQYKTTIMGSGGIKSEHAVTPEMREVHHSHYGFLDPIHTPESKRIGANLHLPLGVIKDGKELKTIVLDKSGNHKAITPKEAREAKVVLPGQTGDRVKAYHQGKIIMIKRSEADYLTPAPQALFSWSTNLVPFLPSNQGNRAMMASKMLEQAISLKHREAPLVQVGTPTGTSFESEIGKRAALVAPVDATVKKISEDEIVLQAASGPVRISLYHNFPLNRKSFMNHEVKVKVGDKVAKGQILADSNYTKNGELALGVNLKTAYIPYAGLNFEDGIVITERAAKQLTSEHIYKKSIEIGDGIIVKLAAFRGYYPNTLSPDNLKKLDSDGVIKKGEKIKMGEAVVTALQRRVPSAQIAAVRKQLSERPKDVSVYWTIEDDGEIVDVQKSAKLITIFVKTEEPAKIGDKLSGRMGNKGIITKIISDAESPHTKDGDPVDIMLNPHGVISRINIGQIYESAVGKAAKKGGKPIVIDNFTGENYLDKTKKVLSDAKVDDKEELFDPTTGKSLGKVHVGNPYILKLFKQSTANFSNRQGGPGNPYDVNQQPLKAGGEESSKSLDLLTMYSLLSHGARINLKEMSWLKSNQNDEYWKALKSGQLLPPPKSPFVYEKFMGYLKGAGIDVQQSGSKLTLSPLTDSEVRKMSSGEVSKPVFYRAKDMDPIRGGFFDPVKFGGFKGTKWGHIELSEPTVNPVFETAVKKITNLGAKYDSIMAGELFIDKKGEFNKKGEGVTGGRAIEHILKGIDVDSELVILRKKILSSKGTALDDLNKRIRYLSALKQFKMRPEEAYLRKVVPVVPPIYRPVYALPDGNVTSSDVNFIYQNIGVLDKMSKLPVLDLLAEEEKAPLRKDIYEHVKGVSGLTDLSIKGRTRSGFISEIKGGSGGQPKEGFFISKMLSKRQDYVGRGTIIPEPTLGVDEVALPKKMAWKLFEPFVIRELVRLGKTPNQALDEIKQESLLAQKALEIVMKERKVLLNRAPSLHKFSIMAFKPKLTDGTAIKIPPLVVKGFNADFDGDTMTVHVPISDAAVKEADKMLPSKNLFQPGTGKLMMTPSQEAQIGIYYLSKTTEGRKRLNKILGPKHAITQVLDKKQTGIMLDRLAKELSSNEFGRIMNELKSIGERHAYDRGFTLGISDLRTFDKDVKKIVDKVGELVLKNPQMASQLSDKATDMVDKIIDRGLSDKDNPLYDMVVSGARGSKSQLRSILATPLFVTDARGRIVPTPIRKSYAEGLDIGDYWTSMYGARRGMMDRAIQTSLPGAFSKDIMANTVDNVIAGGDCGTKEGISLPIESSDAIDRYLAGNQGAVVHNTLVDQRAISQLKRAGAKTIKVRSSLSCRLPKGICQKCYGLDESGTLPDLGENVGAISGQAMSEPLVQMVMNTFHTGGTASDAKEPAGYQRIDQLLKMPKIVPTAAALSTKTGLVSKINPGLGGGFDVYIGDTKIYVARGLKLKVKVGSSVEAGDPLSDGVIKPQDLVKYKGMDEAQRYVVDELQRAYKGQGVGMQRKTFETVVRSLSNTTQVMNNSKDSEFVPGDIAPYTVVRAYNENLLHKVDVDSAAGHKLAKNYGPFNKGYELLEKDIKLLKALGHKQIEVNRDAVVHAPVLKSVNALPLLKGDWMSALGYRNLAKALVEGAGQAWSTDLKDYHPIPAFAHGAAFGDGKDGKY